MHHRHILRLAALALTLALGLVHPAGAQTLEQMAGQMIVVGFAGDDAGDVSVRAIRDEIGAGVLGGVMYLRPNIKSLEAVRAMNSAFRDASPALPPLITLDQEGGMVERLTRDVGFAELPRAAQVAERDAPAAAETRYAGMAAAIADLGFTLNLAPVVDLNVNPANPIIGKFGRAFGADPETVAIYAAAFVRAHHVAGVLTALKHFPGHGSSTGDSHEGFVDISSSWGGIELAPYRALIAAGLADTVMVGHLYHADYDDGGRHLPSSLSKAWIDVLRDELEFDGVAISDDLEMGAIRSHFSIKDSVLTAVRAGVDVLLFSNTADYDPRLAAKVRAILVAEAERDVEFRARVEQSYGRIVGLKERIGR